MANDQIAGETQCSVETQALPRFDVSGQVVSEAVMGVSWGADHRGALLARPFPGFRCVLATNADLEAVADSIWTGL
jgi:hypothetical protein